jgi:hypothetical protein
LEDSYFPTSKNEATQKFWNCNLKGYKTKTFKVNTKGVVDTFRDEHLILSESHTQ